MHKLPMEGQQKLGYLSFHLSLIKDFFWVISSLAVQTTPAGRRGAGSLLIILIQRDTGSHGRVWELYRSCLGYSEGHGGGEGAHNVFYII